MKCGSCKQDHDTVAQVRACYEAQGAGEAEAMTTRTYGKGVDQPPTEKQVKFLKALARTYSGEAGVEAVDEELASGLTKNGASIRIDSFKKAGVQPTWTSTTSNEVELDDGIYVVGDETYKVVHAIHGSGKQYAKKLIRKDDGKWSWKYAGRKPLAGLKPEHRMTQEDAAEFGKLYGLCVRCAADLTRETSIYAGYGPTCAKNEGWHYPTKTELAELTAG